LKKPSLSPTNGFYGVVQMPSIRPFSQLWKYLKYEIRIFWSTFHIIGNCKNINNSFTFFSFFVEILSKKMGIHNRIFFPKYFSQNKSLPRGFLFGEFSPFGNKRNWKKLDIFEFLV